MYLLIFLRKKNKRKSYFLHFFFEKIVEKLKIYNLKWLQIYIFYAENHQLHKFTKIESF